MYIKINGLIEDILLQLIDDDFTFEELVKSSAELVISEQEWQQHPMKETTYYVGLYVEFIAEGGDSIILTQKDGKTFTLPKSDYENITIV